MNARPTLFLLLLVLASPYSLAQSSTDAPPSVEQLKALLAQQKYQDVIRGVARNLALKGPAAQSVDRYAMLMLRGEAYLRTRAVPPAVEAFAAAEKETTDASKRDLARANQILLKKSKPQGYLPRPSPTSKPAAIPIAEEADRKAAWAALLNDELTAAAPKVKAATAGNSLNPIIDVARTLGDLHAV